ncbi:carboxy terminal-processing peptidase [Spectribacter hydrogenooxidans]|uniref:Carboxy terminal-processing peptidase n=1 Tax=Spectribacter hydrogenoxidans TaxID=3075608 RepID=A0ABU3C0P1_9GAMM|nr:carboxy terminal-processing peptidase [Salinisphaera sp. W335]MDT0634941.1 carboxy terminal-processing peptidase [Salinisphaera sp. W335]
MSRFVVTFASAILLLQACQAGSVAPEANTTGEFQPLQPGDAQVQIDKQVVQRLQDEHYNPVALDDDFSRDMLLDYIEDLDGTHSVFLASDIERFKQEFGDRLDDDLRDGELGAAFDIFNTYQQRRLEVNQWILSLLDEGVENLDLTDAESVMIEREEAPWPADDEARRKLWRHNLENQVINLHLNDVEPDDIQDRMTRRYESEREQLLAAEPIDVISAYMGAYTHRYDPHTDYFSPSRSEEFDIGMNLSLQGIGAQLRDRNGYTELVRLIPGGPAAKSGKLSPTDRIIAVGQGKEGDLVDVVGMRLDRTVQLIRGEKGSTVRLQILPKDNSQTRTISLVRDEIELKDQAASSRIVPLKDNGETRRIGLITLPSFYKGTADDVEALLKELRENDVDGVVLDLRGNGGGALREVTKLVGLFMPASPSVQIRDASGNTQVLGANGDPVYPGPLAVMVNRLSASASEIFAGAIQDYGRGVILGQRTFGKGTVQALMPLSKGRVKLTQAKFYRVTGASTQARGVEPDISFPSPFNIEEIGESALPNALPWDKIDSVAHPQLDTLKQILPTLRERHEKRVADDTDFQYQVKRIDLLRGRSERKTLSLQLEERREQQAEFRERSLALVNDKRRANGEEPFEDYQAFQDSEDDVATPENPTGESEEEEEPDAYQQEAARILLDTVNLLEARAGGRAI